MEVTELRVNYLKRPLGFQLDKPVVTFKVKNTKAKEQVAARIEVALNPSFNNKCFDTGRDEAIKENRIVLDMALSSRTRYYYRVTVWNEIDEKVTSKTEWFETGKMSEPWAAVWIAPMQKPNNHPIFIRDFICNKKIQTAKLYISGLGVYEAYLNNKKAGDEYLSPGYHDYDSWIQYQTYDVTEMIETGNNTLFIYVGNGWYKGRLGFNGGRENSYGDEFMIIAELHIEYEDGMSELISTNSDFKVLEGPILQSGIYYGEDIDGQWEPGEPKKVKEAIPPCQNLSDRLSPPVCNMMEWTVDKVIESETELILDVGQNMVGWITFYNFLPANTKIQFQFGEILQDGKFYRENLRFAEAQFTYISSGKEEWIRPHFSFFGFRYIKVITEEIETFTKMLRDNHLKVVVLHSAMEVTGDIVTSNPLVNRLFENIMWGQRGNFLDVPTDCPQRDERLGWTGDAQVFSGTAAYNMGVYPFYKKYLTDMWNEQKKINGVVPMVVPAMKIDEPVMEGAAVWGDAATIIPWNLYCFYQDKNILESQYESMKAWAAYEMSRENGKHLWQSGFQFGDWLALDGKNPQLPGGGTEEGFIASAYYYHTIWILARTAEILGKEEAEEYREKGEQIKQAFQDEYIAANGKLTIHTETAYTLVLYFKLFKEHQKQRIIADFLRCLDEENYEIKTGFVGTPLICRVLSEYGLEEVAYTLLLSEGYPGWLYAVKLGATTIWERWNSVLPDGSMNPQGMNSLNHYAYGSIGEWMYEYMVGIQKKQGFKEAIIRPRPDARLMYAKGEYNSPAGKYMCQWEARDDGYLEIKVGIPFNAKADLYLPYAKEENIDGGELVGRDIKVHLTAGEYVYRYQPCEDFSRKINKDIKVKELEYKSGTKKQLHYLLPEYANLRPDKRYKVGSYSLGEMLEKNICGMNEDIYMQIIQGRC